MAGKRKPSPWAEEQRRRRHLQKWRSSVLGPARRLGRGNFDYVCQVTDTSFLFLRSERVGRRGTFLLFDAADISFKPFSVPALNSLLVDFSLEEQSLRFDADTGAFFYCSRRSQKDGGPGFYLVPGQPDAAGARWISTESEVLSLFVSARHVYLLDAENAKLIRISKAGLLAMAEAAGASKPVSLVPPGSRARARELGLREIPLGDRLEGEGVPVTAFSKDRLIIGLGERYAARFPVYPKLHALDFASNRFKEFCFPTFACADLAAICGARLSNSSARWIRS